MISVELYRSPRPEDKVDGAREVDYRSLKYDTNASILSFTEKVTARGLTLIQALSNWIFISENDKENKYVILLENNSENPTFRIAKKVTGIFGWFASLFNENLFFYSSSHKDQLTGTIHKNLSQESLNASKSDETLLIGATAALKKLEEKFNHSNLFKDEKLNIDQKLTSVTRYSLEKLLTTFPIEDPLLKKELKGRESEIHAISHTLTKRSLEKLIELYPPQKRGDHLTQADSIGSAVNEELEERKKIRENKATLSLEQLKNEERTLIQSIERKGSNPKKERELRTIRDVISEKS